MDPEYQNALKKRQSLFKLEEGSLQSLLAGRDNHPASENLMNAIDIRMHKQKHTDFFYKLDELKDRIEVYNELFNSNIPKYLRKKETN